MILEFIHYPMSRADIHDKGGHNQEYIATMPYCRVEFVVYPYGDRWRVRVERRSESESRTIMRSPVNHHRHESAQDRAQQIYDADPALWTLLDEMPAPPVTDAENLRIAEFWCARARDMNNKDRERVLAGYATVYKEEE